MQRIIGFFVTVGLGFFFMFLSTLVILNPTKFAIAFTFGNILSLGSSVFLVGPKRQCKNMTAKNRWVASLIYLFSMFITLFVAFRESFIGQGLVMMFFIALQASAVIWYTLSFVPFARKLVKGICCASIA